MKFSHQTYFLLVIVFCLAFSLISYNVLVNGHFHIDGSGHIIFHTHPYTHEGNSNQPFKQHSHSKLQLLVLDLITTLFLLIFIPYLLSLLFPTHDGLALIFVQSITPYLLTILPFRRGPPSF